MLPYWSMDLDHVFCLFAFQRSNIGMLSLKTPFRHVGKDNGERKRGAISPCM